jgi:hypothetical protein
MQRDLVRHGLTGTPLIHSADSPSTTNISILRCVHSPHHTTLSATASSLAALHPALATAGLQVQEVGAALIVLISNIGGSSLTLARQQSANDIPKVKPIGLEVEPSAAAWEERIVAVKLDVESDPLRWVPVLRESPVEGRLTMVLV